jgi:hypothetical protein
MTLSWTSFVKAGITLFHKALADFMGPTFYSRVISNRPQVVSRDFWREDPHSGGIFKKTLPFRGDWLLLIPKPAARAKMVCL